LVDTVQSHRQIALNESGNVQNRRLRIVFLALFEGSGQFIFLCFGSFLTRQHLTQVFLELEFMSLLEFLLELAIEKAIGRIQVWNHFC
ncbi:MAG: hypothetical protein ACK56F_25305, partial [bacterium]